MVKQSSFSRFHDAFLIDSTIQKEVAASVVFGQSSLSCKGSGICRVDMAVLKANATDETPEGAWVCKPYNVQLKCSYQGHLVLRILHTSIDQYLLYKQFENGRFIVDEEFVLPAWLVNRLKLKSTRIAQGNYTYTEDEIGLTIRF